MVSIRLILLLLLVLPQGRALAHEVRPGFLGMEEFEPGKFEVTWKQPVVNQRRLPLEPVLPARCTTMNQEVPRLSITALIQRWRVDCGPKGLTNAEIAIDGLSVTLTDVLVRADLLDGTMVNQVLRPNRPRCAILADNARVLPAYLAMGLRNLLSGLDHMLFIICLVLVAGNTRLLIKALTALTLSYSLTLGLSSMDLVRPPQAPVDAATALTLLVLAVELMRDTEERSRLLFGRPWVVAAVFGLVHGFGFAGALGQVGLPSDAPIQAVLLYNLGVEIALVGVVLIALGGVAMGRRLAFAAPGWLVRVPVISMGSLAVFWVMDRIASIVTGSSV
jgi:hypothetical protein